MIPIILRALSTVITVVVAVAVAAHWGDSNGGKVLSAVLIAIVIALVEAAMIWAPKHSARARRLLDPRSIMVGIWVQEVTWLWATDRDPVDLPNRFAVFVVDYAPPGGYSVSGRAYDKHGREHARWWSVESVMFGSNGREMTYVFDGMITDVRTGKGDPDRTGLTKLTLASDNNSGTGRVEHVALNSRLTFDMFRITSSWLKDKGLDRHVDDPNKLRNVAAQRNFALAFARTLGSGGDQGSA